MSVLHRSSSYVVYILCIPAFVEQAAIDLPDNIEEVIGRNVTISGVIHGGTHITLQKRNIPAGKFEDVYTSKYLVLNSTITIYFLSAVDGGEYRACVASLVVPSNMACTDFIITVTGMIIVNCRQSIIITIPWEIVTS